MTSIADALRDVSQRLGASASDSPDQEARWLLGHILQKPSAWIAIHRLDSVDPATKIQLDSLIERRLEGEPLSYVLGSGDFYGRRFLVDDRVLSPRPETEELLEAAIQWARSMPPRSGSRPLAVDVGTGSGVVALTLALELPSFRVIGTDLSDNALAVARLNRDRHHLSTDVEFVRASGLDAIAGPIDLLAANLPYVRTDQLSHLQPEVLREPRIALDGGPDGFEIYRNVLRQAHEKLAPSGGLFFEIGSEQGSVARSFASELFPEYRVAVVSDLSGRDRVLAVSPKLSPTASRGTRSPLLV